MITWVYFSRAKIFSKASLKKILARSDRALIPPERIERICASEDVTFVGNEGGNFRSRLLEVLDHLLQLDAVEARHWKNKKRLLLIFFPNNKSKNLRFSFVGLINISHLMSKASQTN